MIQPWPLLESTELGEYRVFKLRRDVKSSPRTGHAHEMYVLDCPDWVNVVALTPQRDLVMVEQYRHGTNTTELEIPGGVIDSNDPSPIDAGIRELREETGFAGRNPVILSCILPNPAIMSNKCYTILVEDCVRTHPVQFDQGEDIVTRLMPWPEIPDAVASGRIRHSLVIVALYQFELWTRGHHKTKK